MIIIRVGEFGPTKYVKMIAQKMLFAPQGAHSGKYGRKREGAKYKTTSKESFAF
jgi:hypothetical protein